jgi:arylsulfatase
LVDAFIIYGGYGCETNINEAEASAALLLMQLVVLLTTLAMVGLAKVLDRLAGHEVLYKAMFLLSVCAILLMLLGADAYNNKFYDFQTAIPNSIVVLASMWVITLHVILGRQLLKRWSTRASDSILSYEHLALAVPMVTAIVLVSISESSDRLAYTRWFQPVFIAMGFAFLIIAFIPVENLKYLLGKSILLTAACIGIVLAPFASEQMHVSSLVREETPTGAPQHVLLLTVDTLRADALSVHEGSSNHTPALKKLAEQSAVFDNAISPSSWTIPATSSIMTGVYPMTHQVVLSKRFSEKLTTIGETFAAHGYRTGAIVNNPILFPSTFVTDMDFQEFQAFPSKQSPRASFGLRLLWRLFPERWPATATTTDMTDLATQWYDRRQHDQTFLWVHYLDPHTPYAPPSKYLKSVDTGRRILNMSTPPPNSAPLVLKDRAKENYLAETRYVDDEIGRLLDYLKDKDLFDDMLIVFTSDHGEEFWEHGSSGHGATLFNETIHVPFMIKRPEQGHHVNVSESVSTTDIFPTIAQICELSVDDKVWAGRSLEDFIGPTDARPEVIPVFSAETMDRPGARAVLFNGYKLVLNPETEGDELYRLRSDPKEQENIAQEHPEIVEELKVLLVDAESSATGRRMQMGLSPVSERLSDIGIGDMHDTSGASGANSEILSPEQKEAMKGLGYLD